MTATVTAAGPTITETGPTIGNRWTDHNGCYGPTTTVTVPGPTTTVATATTTTTVTAGWSTTVTETGPTTTVHRDRPRLVRSLDRRPQSTGPTTTVPGPTTTVTGPTTTVAGPTTTTADDRTYDNDYGKWPTTTVTATPSNVHWSDDNRYSARRPSDRHRDG